MSILDIAAKVITTYQADVSDMKAKLGQLTGAEKELAQQELAAAEARNKQSDAWLGKLNTIGGAYNTLKEVGHVAFEGLQEYAHRLDLEATAGSVSLDGLSRAANGLKGKMELLEHAALLNKSAFKLNQEQMETVERGMYALEERGHKSEEVWNAVSTALTKGTTKSLEALIGPIQKTSDAFDVNGDVIQTYGARAKAVDAILKQLAHTALEVKDNQYDAGDAVQANAVKISDAMDTMKQALGKFVAALNPLIAGVAKVVEVAADIVDSLAHPPGIAALSSYQTWVDAAQRVEGGGAALDRAALDKEVRDWQASHTLDLYAPGAFDDPTYGGTRTRGTWESEQLKFARNNEKAAKRRELARERAKEVARIRKNRIWRASTLDSQEGTDKLVNQLELEDQDRTTEELTRFVLAQPLDSRIDSFLTGTGKPGDEQGFMGGYLGVKGDWRTSGYGKQQAQGYDKFNTAKKNSFLEETFGKLEDFSAYKIAFDSLSGATSAALGAWIDGSMSAGQAFKKFIAEALKGLASQMLIESLKHGAYALGSLAFGDVGGAAKHGVAALAFGAGAAAAAVAAKALGGSATPATSGPRASAPNVTGPAAAAAGPTGGIVVIGDSFADDTPRMKQLRAQRLIAMAIGSNNAVVYG